LLWCDQFNFLRLQLSIGLVILVSVSQAGSVDIEIGSEQRPDIIDTSHSNSDDESNFQGNNLVITAKDDKRETEATQGIENSETDEERNLTHLGNQESKADHLEGADVSADVVPTETRYQMHTTRSLLYWSDPYIRIIYFIDGSLVFE